MGQCAGGAQNDNPRFKADLLRNMLKDGRLADARRAPDLDVATLVQRSVEVRDVRGTVDMDGTNQDRDILQSAERRFLKGGAGIRQLSISGKLVMIFVHQCLSDLRRCCFAAFGSTLESQRD